MTDFIKVEWINGVQYFYPTSEHFRRGFPWFIDIAEQEFKPQEQGVAVVVPPFDFCARVGGYSTSDMRFKISNYLKQDITSQNGCFILKSRYVNLTESMSPEDYLKMRSKTILSNPKDCGWNTNDKCRYYATDINTSLFDVNVDGWNFRRLGTFINDYEIPTWGIQTPLINVAQPGSVFAYHVEDADLGSANYLHCGEPKTWIALPPKQGPKFKNLCWNLLPDVMGECEGPNRHKRIYIPTEMLAKNGITFYQVTYFILFWTNLHTHLYIIIQFNYCSLSRSQDNLLLLFLTVIMLGIVLVLILARR